MAETKRNWYVLRAVSGKEVKVKEYIEAAMKLNETLSKYVFQVKVPTEKHATTRNGKRVVKDKVSLPGYVLVQAELVGDVAHMLRFIPNVLGFLGGMDNPSPAREADINRMLGNVEQTELEEDVAIDYLEGDAVTVTDGPFSGFSGVVDEILEETDESRQSHHKNKVEIRKRARLSVEPQNAVLDILEKCLVLLFAACRIQQKFRHEERN